MAGHFVEQQGRPTAAELAEALLDFVAAQIEDLAEHHAPGLVLPRVFAGHPVGPDTRSDLANTLGLLYEAGRKELCGVPLADAVLETLVGLDGKRTDTFYSYRAAETLGRLGGYHDNPRLAGLAEEELANLCEAFDSSASAEHVREGRLPKNYAVVVARCEHAREQLGLLPDGTILEELCERSQELVGLVADGWIDDSNEQRGQYDIYTADIFLFAEPLSERLGDAWSHGLRRVLRDVDSLALPGGGILWGRSIGALGLALTIELASLGAARGFAENAEEWIARAAWTLTELRRWFSHGVLRSHQHRSTMFYRGPARRLQMTLDVLGKLAMAALDLRQVPDLRASAPHDAWRPVDRFVPMGAPGRNREAGAWAHRSPNLAFALPLVGGYSSDYLPAPRAPSLFETPTSGPICMVPVVHHKGKQLVAAGVPVRVTHGTGELEALYEGFAEVSAGPEQPKAIEGSRVARFRVEGRSLFVEEEISLDAAPETIGALALQVPVLSKRPLRIEFESDAPHRVDVIDVEGLAEYRSFWSEIATVHQIELEPPPRNQKIALRWCVTPKLRVASTAHGHWYDDALYRPLGDQLVPLPAPNTLIDRPHALREIDVLHMHWPEWWQGPDLERNQLALERLREAGTRIVWTQHNLAPHAFRDRAATRLYEMWARAAHAVIHHTEWGRARAQERYDYNPDAIHRVIPHGHWGDRYSPHALFPRERVEADLELSPCALRLGIVGAPRVEKDVQLVLDAFHACSREDLQLLVLCLQDEEVPDDPRIRAQRSAHVDEHIYYQRLAAIDVLVFPFREGMLMTGTAFDAIGADTAALTSNWPVLTEVLGDAAIPYGSTREDLTACLEALTEEQVAASAAAMKAVRARTAWGDSASQTLALLEEVAIV